MPDDKDDPKPTGTSDKEGAKVAGSTSPAAKAAPSKAKPAARRASDEDEDEEDEDEEDEDEEDEDEDEEDDEDEDEEDDEDEDEEEDEEPPPPPPKKKLSSEAKAKALVSKKAIQPNRPGKAAPARKQAARPMMKKRTIKQPIKRFPHPPASYFVPFVLLGLGFIGLHVYWDVPYAPVAVLGISIAVWAFMGIGSANEVHSS